MGCIEIFVEGFALSEDFIIRCDKFMLINFELTYCAQFEVPSFKIKKIICVFLAFIVPFNLAPQNCPLGAQSNYLFQFAFA